jgi:hypothetical protein
LEEPVGLRQPGGERTIAVCKSRFVTLKKAKEAKEGKTKRREERGVLACYLCGHGEALVEGSLSRNATRKNDRQDGRKGRKEGKEGTKGRRKKRTQKIGNYRKYYPLPIASFEGAARAPSALFDAIAAQTEKGRRHNTETGRR